MAETPPTVNLFDRTLKVIARNHAALFLRLALPGAPIQLLGTLENVELSLPVRPVDFIHRIGYKEAEHILHLEFQLEHEADFPRRMCSYHGALTDQFKLPVLSFALYLRYRQAPIPNEYVVRLDETVLHRFTYPVLRLWDYIDEIRNGHYRELAPLLVMLVQRPTEATLQEERQLILAEPDPQKRADLLALAISIAGRSFNRDFLWRFFRDEVEQMQQATFVEEWVEEGIQRGFQSGIKQGVRQSIFDILRVRFNPNEAQLKSVAQRLEQITDGELLKEFVDHALRDFSLEEFTARLSALPQFHQQPANDVTNGEH
jgi:hypothetical protein